MRDRREFPPDICDARLHGKPHEKVLTWTSNMRRSGAARVTALLPMAPDAPGRFYATTGWTSAACYAGVARLVTMSRPVPEVMAAMMVAAPSCANAGAASSQVLRFMRAS